MGNCVSVSVCVCACACVCVVLIYISLFFLFCWFLVSKSLLGVVSRSGLSIKCTRNIAHHDLARFHFMPTAPPVYPSLPSPLPLPLPRSNEKNPGENLSCRLGRECTGRRGGGNRYLG